MKTRAHTHTEDFAVAPSVLFELLHKPSAIRQWWGATSVIVLSKAGGFWAASWGDNEDAPDYLGLATISEFDPPRKMTLANNQYFAKEGPLPFEASLTVKFEVAPSEKGSNLTVIHEGFPAGAEADDYFNGCVQGWINTFAGIRRFLGDA